MNCSEHQLDCQHVISMSLEKISSERKRRNGANLHRSLMICDLLVRLRSHLLTSEDSEVRPTVAQTASTDNIPSNYENQGDSEANDAEDEDEKENEKSDLVSSNVSSDSHFGVADVKNEAEEECQPVDGEQRSVSQTVDRRRRSRSRSQSQSRYDAFDSNVSVNGDVSTLTGHLRTQSNVLLNKSSNQQTEILTQAQTCSLQHGAQRRKRLYSAMSDDAEVSGDGDKRCRMVPESYSDSLVADNQPDAQSDALQNAALNGYIAVPITLLNANDVNGVSYSVGGYVLSGNLLFAYPTQVCTPIKTSESLQPDAITGAGNMPLVIVIN